MNQIVNIKYYSIFLFFPFIFSCLFKDTKKYKLIIKPGIYNIFDKTYDGRDVPDQIRYKSNGQFERNFFSGNLLSMEWKGNWHVNDDSIHYSNMLLRYLEKIDFDYISDSGRCYLPRTPDNIWCEWSEGSAPSTLIKNITDSSFRTNCSENFRVVCDEYKIVASENDDWPPIDSVEIFCY